MKWLVLVLALVCGSAHAQIGLPFPGPGTPASSGVTPPAYSFINLQESTATGSGITQSFALGANATCRVIVGVSLGASAATVTSLTVGGVALSQDNTKVSTGANTAAFLYSANLASCTGSQSLVLASTVGSFSYRAVWVWVATNLTVNGAIATGGYQLNAGTRTPTSPTISVTAADIMIGMIASTGTSATCAASSVAPTATHPGSTTPGTVGADWLIASTNASFAISCDASITSRAVAVATYH